MSRGLTVDDCLFAGDAVELGVMLFGVKVCTACGRQLPRNADYFATDRSRTDGLTSRCRSCRRARERLTYHQRTRRAW